MEELILTDETPKQENVFKQPGTNSALRKASTAGLTEGPPGGPPNIKRLSCVDEEPKASKWQGMNCFKYCFGTTRSSSVMEIKN